MKQTDLKWLLRMGWRESRNQKKKLLLYISSITVGIAALVAINSFRANLEYTVDAEAKTLLGADLVLRSNRPFSEKINQFVDSLKFEKAKEVSFSSMVYFPKNGQSRLSRIRAIGDGFPFYGKIETQPQNVYAAYQESANTIIDESMLIQFSAEVGDSVNIGNIRFHISAGLRRVPGQSAAGSAIAPTVFIPISYLDQTGLIQFGSLAIYRIYLKTDPEFDLDNFINTNKEFFAQNGVRYETVQQRKEQLGRVTNNLSAFFNLIGLFALILGSIGVSSSITVYIRQKMSTVAVLRCLGSSSKQVFNIYLLQTLIFGFIGTLLGVLLGILVQFLLPGISASILPVKVNLFLSWTAIIEGFIGGFIITVLFTLLPLLQIRHVSPLITLRSAFEDNKTQKTEPAVFIVIGLILLTLVTFLQLQFNNWTQTLLFTLTLIIAIALFLLIARLLMKLLRNAVPKSWNYSFRQGLANLYRPQNQTALLLLALGIGTFLIATLYLTQNALLNQIAFSGSGERPNMILFDIQTDQKEAVKEKIKNFDLPLMQQASIVTMRLQSVNDVSITELAKDTTGRYERWALRGELRSTYRDSLSNSEEVIKGKFYSTVEDTVFISIADGYVDALGLDIGDKLIFDIQGVPLTTYVGSIREVNWQRIQPNFLVVFPGGVLEDAPQFHVLVTRVANAEQSAVFQREMVESFPGVSIVDLGLIIQTVEKVLDEFAFVIRFLAFFTILTGLVVLVGSLNISRLQRIKEAVLLRTMGAKKQIINTIMVIEYFLLGGISSLIGIGLAVLFTWILTLTVFDALFAIPLSGLLIIFLTITALTVLIGITGNRRILNFSPLEILREE